MLHRLSLHPSVQLHGRFARAVSDTSDRRAQQPHKGGITKQSSSSRPRQVLPECKETQRPTEAWPVRSGDTQSTTAWSAHGTCCARTMQKLSALLVNTHQKASNHRSLADRQCRSKPHTNNPGYWMKNKMEREGGREIRKKNSCRQKSRHHVDENYMWQTKPTNSPVWKPLLRRFKKEKLTAWNPLQQTASN